MAIEIRAATADDEARVLRLIEQLFEPPASRPPDYDDARGKAGFDFCVENADADILLALDGDDIVGLATVYVVFPALRYGLRCWLQDLVVDSEHRSEGVGRLLLDAASEWARDRGCTHLKLDSSHARKDAHRFYEREGMAQGTLTFERTL